MMKTEMPEQTILEMTEVPQVQEFGKEKVSTTCSACKEQVSRES